MTTALDCARARPLLLDEQRGRLDAATAVALAAHLDSCADCRYEDDVERVLTEQLEQRMPQHAAPLALKRRLAATLPAAGVRVAAARRRRRWALAASLIAASLVGITVLFSLLAPPRVPPALVAEAVNDHLRVLSRPLELPSTEVHQVRPWFAGRLDFAPVIPFAGDAEFPLRGATVEYFGDRKAAVVVYGRRLHTITLLVFRPDGLAWARSGQALSTRERGFNVRLWQASGLGYALVSDADPEDLTRLAERLGG
jgi:anti-sigma factor RsiW